MNPTAASAGDHCATEPIHLLERVQSYGAMAVFAGDSRRLVACTGNFPVLLGLTPLASPASQHRELTLDDVLQVACSSFSDAFRERWSRRPLPSDWTADVAGQALHFFWHRGQGLQPQDILEVTVEATAEAPLSEGEALTALARFSEQIQPIRSFVEAMNYASERLLTLLGYSRALVYRFDEEMNGEVIAESWAPTASKQEALYSGLRFPASDIPPQARRLYEKNLVRIIADANDPGWVLEHASEASNPPMKVDLTHSLLRRPSDMHLMYMRNMGVLASTVTSLMVDGRLWGMVVCQGEEPRVPPHNTRAIALGFCQIASTIISSKLKWIESEAALKRQAEEGELLEELEVVLKRDHDPRQQREAVCNLLRRATRSDDVFLSVDAELEGLPPHVGPVMDVLKEIEPARDRLLVAEREMASSARFSTVALSLTQWSGIAAWQHRGNPEVAIVCLRSRRTDRVSWGGDPKMSTPVTLADGTSVLGPRRSFARWIEENHQRSEPWLSGELEFLERAGALVAKAIADERLRAVQGEYDLVASLLPLIGDMVVAWRPSSLNADECPVFVNESFRRRFNLQTKRVRYSSWVPANMQAEVAEGASGRKVLTSVATDRVELIDTHGRRTWVDRSYTFIPASTETPALVTCVLRDVSEAVDREQQLVEAKRTLESKVAERTAELSKAIRDLECLSYSMAHDLRAPLRSINGFASLLHEDLTEGNDERSVYARKIGESSRLMGQMISDLLDLIRVVNEDLLLERVMLPETLAGLADSLVADSPSIRLRLETVPPVMGDARLLRQLFLNLFDNAIKYRRLDVDLEVLLGFDEASGRYFVSDNGSGFDTGVDGDPFLPFRRMRNARGITGSGVGLAVVSRIVERLHGEVSIDSTPAAGTTVWLKLPVAQVAS